MIFYNGISIFVNDRGRREVRRKVGEKDERKKGVRRRTEKLQFLTLMIITIINFGISALILLPLQKTNFPPHYPIYRAKGWIMYGMDSKLIYKLNSVIISSILRILTS